ncbi:MAG: hypothetical protein AAF307_08095 [Pseudomonadota bacterium]
MTYDECLRSTYLDWESWLIALVSLAISFALRKYGKTSFAIVSGSFGLLLAVSWAYLFYELNCVELIGL